MSEWKEYKLGELVTVNEKSIGRDFKLEMIEYIDTSSVTENKFESPLTTPLVNAPSRAKRLIRDGDTIISTVRPIQKHYGFIKKAKDNQVVSTGFAVVTPNSIEPRFLYYFLTQAEITEYLNKIAEGGTTTFPAFKADELKELPISIPDLPTQTAIAEILSSLDDKIELNNKINQELEHLAQILFKQWFIDFEFPNENGEPYKSSGGEMVDSELREIPKGWKVSKLGEISKIIDCLHSKKPEILKEETGYLYLQLNNISDNGVLDLKEKYWISEIDYQKWTSRIEVNEGDFVITNVGRTGAVSRITKGVKAAIGRNMTAIRLLEVFPFKNYFTFLLLSDFMKSEIESKLDAGTILDALNVRSIPKLRFVYEDKYVAKFEKVAEPIWNKIEANKIETYSLIELRDTLLPKLISGELEVSQIQTTS